MRIVDAIRAADSKHVLFFLLTSYIAAMQLDGNLPESVAKLPIEDIDDVTSRLVKLRCPRCGRQEAAGASARAVRDEALQVFEAALRRIELLEEHATTTARSVVDARSWRSDFELSAG